MQDALRACFGRIGRTAAGINILEIPCELNGEIDFGGLSMNDGPRSSIYPKTFRELNEHVNVFGRIFQDLFPVLDDSYDTMLFWEFMTNMQWGDKVLPEGKLVFI